MTSLVLTLTLIGAFWLILRQRRVEASTPAGRWPGVPVGVMLGLSAMVALGCTVGVIMSGIMVGGLSGWVFAVACFTGAWTGWRLRAPPRQSG
ncbi:YeeE/YedE thiosulfate transporter family protein [Paenirhodobacter populi]|uniref:Uncharacterized protein n=1 Tax=Paenirhodobacter populi TaxID=2306993 RepID=A0A443J8M6_9RHOB|nr:YeeE/YedE thiosulfate transporter family protein [Sinirhodobacter populi]RWR04325.1 hypothetical protein D2T32_19935 [Sinirhodobacter populi]RWR16878.1 hypothetical protein D2T30_20525 [Sinirhodobacter populi]